MEKVRLKYIWLLTLVTAIRHNDDGSILRMGKGGKVKATKNDKIRNKYRPGQFNEQSAADGLSVADLSIVNSILQATLASEEPTPSPEEDKVILGLRSGFQNVVDTISLEKSKTKDKQNQKCLELSEAINLNQNLDQSLRSYGFVASCNRHNYKNSGCFVKCQKGYTLNAKKPLVTCRCRKRKGKDGNGEVQCKWDGIADMKCLSTAPMDLARNGLRQPACDRPTNLGVFTILDTWDTGLMSMISTSVNTNVSDWTLLLEWNKPLKSRKSYLWNAKLDSVSKDLTLWTIMNKAKAARDEKDHSKVEFGMVIDKIERRDYSVEDLSASVYFWNYNYPNASCWASDINSKIKATSSHQEEITRTRLGIQPAKETEKYCYYGTYENTNVWKHSGSQYRVHGHVEFELPVPLGDWEIQLVWDEGRKMVVLETPQMVKNDKSTDGQYWSFRAQEYNEVIYSKKVKFFVQGAMWRSAPAARSVRTMGAMASFFGVGALTSTVYNPEENLWRLDPLGAVRICGVEADWAAQQTQRSQLFSVPKYTGECSALPEVNSYDFVENERCQTWSPNAINTINKANIRRWNRSSGCEKLPEDKRLICLSILYIDGQRSGLNATNIPYRSQASTLKDGCDMTDKMGAPLTRDLSGGFFADDGHLKVTKVTAHMVTLVAWSVASNREAWAGKGLTEWALGTIRHGVEWLAEARLSPSDIVVQVGDARTDESCDLPVEQLAEYRPVLASSRKFPATDTMGSFVGAIYAAAHAFSLLGDPVEARKCAKKGEQSLSAMFSGPKGLSGSNAEYDIGQMSYKWSGDCYQDEMAWASAWACLGSAGLQECLGRVDLLLDEADIKCADKSWGWNDVRLGTRLLLAQYGEAPKYMRAFLAQMNDLVSTDIKKLCSSLENATALANIFSMATVVEKIDDADKDAFAKMAQKLIACASRNIIGIRTGSAALTVEHKNANYHEAVLWGGSKTSQLLNSVNLLLSAVLAN